MLFVGQICIILLGFAWLVLGKSSKKFLPNGGFMVMSPMVQSINNHLKQIQVNPKFSGDS